MNALTHKLLRRLALSVVAILGAAHMLPAQVPSAQLPSTQVPATPATDSTVLAIIAARVDAGRHAGIAVGLVTRANVRRVVAYGPNAGVQPFDGNTVFEIGSISKAFTGSVLAQMVKKGEVALSNPVEALLPSGTVVPSHNSKRITLLDLATQSSGLPRMPDNFNPKNAQNPYADYTVENMYTFLASYQLPRDPGEKDEYSNLGFGLLGHALSLRAGKSYEALVTDRILAPLGMKDTRIALTPSMQQRLAPGHTDAGLPAANWDLPTFAGAGALRSTVNDMLTFIHANADSTTKPLGATLAFAHSERRRLTGGSAIGLAWVRTRAPSGNTIVWHNGGTGGYRAFTGYVESTGMGVVVLSNTANSVDDIGMHLLDPSVPLQPIPKRHTQIALPVATLDRYQGVYDVAPGAAITITREESRLFAQATGQGRFELFAEAEDEFFAKVADIGMSFVKDGSGAVVRLIVHQGGQNIPGSRRP